MRLKMLIIGIKLIQTERPEVKALFLECCMFREHNCWGIQPFKKTLILIPSFPQQSYQDLLYPLPSKHS